jgi:hypothetical protein
MKFPTFLATLVLPLIASSHVLAADGSFGQDFPGTVVPLDAVQGSYLGSVYGSDPATGVNVFRVVRARVVGTDIEINAAVFQQLEPVSSNVAGPRIGPVLKFKGTCKPRWPYGPGVKSTLISMACVGGSNGITSVSYEFPYELGGFNDGRFILSVESQVWGGPLNLSMSKFAP